MPDAAELNILERNLFEGDYPDSACEYLLPDMDYVFISGSASSTKPCRVSSPSLRTPTPSS